MQDQKQKDHILNCYLFGDAIEYRELNETTWRPATHIDHTGFDWNNYQYRVAVDSTLAAGYNPERLTNSEVGTKHGWRLLAIEEYNQLHTSKDIQMYELRDSGSCWVKSALGFTASNKKLCYRTMRPKGWFVPKKCKPYTVDTIPKIHTLLKIESGCIYVITSYSPQGITVANYEISYTALADNVKYSLSFDGGKTWQPGYQ